MKRTSFLLLAVGKTSEVIKKYWKSQKSAYPRIQIFPALNIQIYENLSHESVFPVLWFIFISSSQWKFMAIFICKHIVL